MNKYNSGLASKDIQYQLHPYTDARLHQDIGPLIIERGEGVYVYDDKGNRYIEAMSGLWSAALGFSNQRLVQAAERQLRTLPFYHLFSHKTRYSTDCSPHCKAYQRSLSKSANLPSS